MFSSSDFSTEPPHGKIGCRPVTSQEHLSMNFFRACLYCFVFALLPHSARLETDRAHDGGLRCVSESHPRCKSAGARTSQTESLLCELGEAISARTSADDHDRMIFMMASVWPDDIKGEAQYSDDGSEGGNVPAGPASSQNIGYSDLLRHCYWHFVDTPFSPDQTPLPPIPAPNAQTQIVAFRACSLHRSPMNSNPRLGVAHPHGW